MYGESAFLGHGSALYSYQYEIKKFKAENLELREEFKLLKNPDLHEEIEYIRFLYINEHTDSLYIKKTCELLNVYRFEYYKYLEHKPSACDIENDVLQENKKNKKNKKSFRKYVQKVRNFRFILYKREL